MIKTRKIELIPDGDKKYITETIKQYSEESCKMANEIVRNVIFNLQRFNDFKKQNPQFSAKEMGKEYAKVYGLTVSGFAYDVTKDYNIISSVRTSLSTAIEQRLTTNQKNILSNKESIPSYTKDKMPVYFRWQKVKLHTENNKYYFQISKDLTFTLHFGRDRSNNKSNVDKILSGEYKGCDSKITIENGKMFLNLTYKFESQVVPVIEKDLVLGIDLGINRPLTLARSDGKYIPQIELGAKILEVRMQFQKRKKELQRGLKHTKGGRGRNDKMKRLDELRNKEHNTVTTINHIYSKGVIDSCKENNIGKIKMEDLTGITKDSNNYFFKSWPYYQLQQMIVYKAKEAGIEIEYVVAKDTSKTCHCCGVVHETARDKQDVSKFTCQTVDCNMFGKIQDADINAAINISRKGGFKEKPKSKKGRIETWKKKQELLEENLIM